MRPASLSVLPLVALMGCGSIGQHTWPQPVEPDLARLASYEWPDPNRFAEDIRAFEGGDAQQMPPEGAVLAIGSSSMRMWHDHLHQDLAPLTIIPRGFGGSNMHDVHHFVEQVVLPYRPRAILLYEGDNDIATGLTPAAVMDAYYSIKYRVHREDPGVRFYLLPIKPSPSRWDIWPQMQEVNRLYREEAASDPRVTYIDTVSAMLGPDGRPRPELFEDDDLHMNREGYVLWRDAVRPVLVAAEERHEGAPVDQRPH